MPDRDLSDAERVETVFTDAILSIASVLGHADMGWPPRVDTDQLPAVVLNAAKSAMDILAIGISVLDPASPMVDLDADEWLARLNKREDA